MEALKGGISTTSVGSGSGGSSWASALPMVMSLFNRAKSSSGDEGISLQGSGDEGISLQGSTSSTNNLGALTSLASALLGNTGSGQQSSGSAAKASDFYTPQSNVAFNVQPISATRQMYIKGLNNGIQ
ncbi:MAG: hypothetical protein MJ211_10040 [Bacteroidales bacterium]|nr:hypothetical protein [Bacteroidales bacterium]